MWYFCRICCRGIAESVATASYGIIYWWGLVAGAVGSDSNGNDDNNSDEPKKMIIN